MLLPNILIWADDWFCALHVFDEYLMHVQFIVTKSIQTQACNLISFVEYIF